MELNEFLDWKDAIVVIAYPNGFLEENFFSSKIDTAVEGFKDFLIISIDDSSGLIKKYYEPHVAKTITSAGITNDEIRLVISRATHCIFFWDGVQFNKFIHHALLYGKPSKIIPVRITTVINQNTLEPYDVYIGRKSIWGNPFILDKHGNRDEVIEKYKKYFYEEIITDPVKKAELHKLKGKVLGCHCKPLPCHGDIIAEYLNRIDSVT